MKNKTGIYIGFMVLSLAGLGAAFYFLTKKKGVVMQASAPTDTPAADKEYGGTVVNKKIIDDKTVEKTIETSNGEKRVLEITKTDGTVDVIEDMDKFNEDVSAALADFPDFSGVDFSALQNLNLPNLVDLSTLNFRGLGAF